MLDIFSQYSSHKNFKARCTQYSISSKADQKVKVHSMTCNFKCEPWGFYNCGAGPSAFLDRGCLLLGRVSQLCGLPGWVCLGNVTNVERASTSCSQKSLADQSAYSVLANGVCTGLFKLKILVGYWLKFS